MRKILKDNGLSLALFVLFFFSVVGMVLTGWSVENKDLVQHLRPGIGLPDYIASGAFLSALFENWESEFLQMATYVVLTAYMFQRGSSESKDPDKASPEDADPTSATNPDRPRPLKIGGLFQWIYSYSLSLTLAVLFVASFCLHRRFSLEAANEEASLHGQPVQGLLSYLADSEFWFESFQNWQSEFLSTALLVILSIFLRHRGSPESKPVAAPNFKTGS